MAGYHALEDEHSDVVKWVQVDLGRSVVLERVVLSPCYDDFNKIGAGFGFPVRFKIEASDDAEFLRPISIADKTSADFANPGTVPQSFPANGATARFLRITATKLAPRQNDFIFALAELAAEAADASPDPADPWSPWNARDGWWPNLVRPRVLAFQDGETEHKVSVLREGSRWRVGDYLGETDGLRVALDGAWEPLSWLRDGDTRVLRRNGTTWRLRLPDMAAGAGDKGAHETGTHAPALGRGSSSA